MQLDKKNSLFIFSPQHYDKFTFANIKFTSGLNQTLKSK